MHRTVSIGTLNSKPAEVNGTKPKSLRYRSGIALQTAKEPSKDKSLLGSQFVYIGILSDDFATVDFREDYANLSLPKEAKFKRCRTIKTNERKPCAAEKAAADPQSGLAGAAPRRRAFSSPQTALFGSLTKQSARYKSFSVVLFYLVFRVVLSWRVLGCGARARSAKVCGAATAAPQCIKAALVYDKLTPRCQSYFFPVHGSRL